MLLSEDRLNLRFRESPGRALYHTHCHSRSLVGTEPGMAVLSLIPGLDVQESDAGCCGMAGAFGYEKEHYDVSMTIGGQRLFPAVSALGEGGQVVVTGMSCRQQIQHGTNRAPRHLAEVLAEALD